MTIFWKTFTEPKKGKAERGAFQPYVNRDWLSAYIKKHKRILEKICFYLIIKLCKQIIFHKTILTFS